MKDRGLNVPDDALYNAAALSLVLHTTSPLIPTFRSDVRMFQAVDGGSKEVTETWIGGGCDLTPYVHSPEEWSEWHGGVKVVCDAWGMEYGDMKVKCDEYFYIPCRKEHRGVGGVFFDEIMADEKGLGFAEGLVESWMPGWMEIVDRRVGEGWTERQKEVSEREVIGGGGSITRRY